MTCDPKRVLLAKALLLAGLALPAIGLAEEHHAITRPSSAPVMSFPLTGKVAKVLVQQGDRVKKGQPLIQLDDSVEALELQALQEQAEQKIRVEAAEKSLDQKRVELEKKEWAYKRKAATELEVKQARLDVDIAELSLQLSKFQRTQDRLKYLQAKARLDRMTLRSEVDGLVENVLVEPGEVVTHETKAIRVVQIDPLWLDVPVPMGQAAHLQAGAVARVTFSIGQASRDGKVLHVAAVADAASRTRTVRVELPNPDGRAAGEHVTVTFPAAATVADADTDTPAPSR